MIRSFTDRVVAGICGGLGDLLPLGAWFFRALFVLLSVVTLGAFALLYVGLWWLIPQDTPAAPVRRSPLVLLLTLLLMIGTLIGWGAWFFGDFALFWPGLLLGLALVFFLRQLRG